jgi:hypothetical protein
MGKKCINCGSAEASKGSYKYPFCEKCYKKKFNNNISKYIKFWERKQNGSD